MKLIPLFFGVESDSADCMIVYIFCGAWQKNYKFCTEKSKGGGGCSFPRRNEVI